MARTDDYIAAKKIAVEELSRRPFAQVAESSGFSSAADDVFKIGFLDHVYRVSYPDFEFLHDADADKDVPIQEQVLILHYMMAGQTSGPDGKWIAYREIPGAGFYFSAFSKRAIQPLIKVFGHNPDGLVRAAGLLKGTAIDPGDVGFAFQVFPKTSLQLILWQGDEEFPPEANILFDATIGEILSPEDAAWLASLLVYRLISLSHR